MRAPICPPPNRLGAPLRDSAKVPDRERRVAAGNLPQPLREMAWPRSPQPPGQPLVSRKNTTQTSCSPNPTNLRYGSTLSTFFFFFGNVPQSGQGISTVGGGRHNRCIRY